MQMAFKGAGLLLRESTQRIQRCHFLPFSGYAIVVQPGYALRDRSTFQIARTAGDASCRLHYGSARVQYLLAFRRYEQKHSSIYRVSTFVDAARCCAVIISGRKYLSGDVAISFEDEELLNPKVLMNRKRGAR